MPFCRNCGSEVSNDQKICLNCGVALNPESDFSRKAQDAFNNFNNTQDDTNQYSQADIAENKGIGVLCYFGLFLLIPLLIKKESAYIKFHANQGLVLFIVDIIINVITGFFPDMLIFDLISGIVGIGMLVITVIGIVNVVSGKAKELPVFGKIRLIK